MKFITLEAYDKKVGVGAVYAKDLSDAYDQCEWTNDGNNLIVPELQANQLIIDINKMLRRKA